MNKGNVTYLFREPSERHHHSESFWTSLFAMSLLLGSRSPQGLRLPAFRFQRLNSEWWFQPAGSLDLFEPLEWSQVVVEGKIKSEFVPNLQEVIPQTLWDLRPDIFVRRNQHITLIEVKTIGHYLGENQKVRCEEIASYLQRNGYTADLFFLISAGHESLKDWNLLETVVPEAQHLRLLLWEKVLQVLNQTDTTRELIRTIPNLADYIGPEELYMSGVDP